MKPLRLKKSYPSKAIGIALGDRSLLAAEVGGGDTPAVTKVAELVYPDGVTATDADKLGPALGEFLKENGFSAKSAVVGLPARWLVVKPKDVPPADESTLTDLLRIQAEGEFSTELRDLVYDYAADHSAGQPTSVLLIATPKRYVDGAKQMCDGAKLSLTGVTPAAAALAAATGRVAGVDKPLVLAVSSGGAELTAVSGSVPAAIKHLRPQAERAFAGEIRRAFTTLGVGSMAGRSVVLWDGTPHAEGTAGPMSPESLGADLGLAIRAGDLSSLGVDPGVTFNNGDGRRYAAAVALALSGIGAASMPVDFLNSRLAPLPQPKVPRWMILAAVAVIAVIGGIIYAYEDLQKRSANLETIKNSLAGSDDQAKAAQKEVNQMSFAKRWYKQDPRYLSCLNDLSATFPPNGMTYVRDLTLRDAPPPPSSASASGDLKPDERRLVGLFHGAAPSVVAANQLLDSIRANKAFSDARLENYIDKDRELTFTISFRYTLKGVVK